MFTEAATKAGKSDDYIKNCLNYAKALSDKHLPIIYDIHHFSQLIGIRLDFLLAISNSPRKFYRYFTIPKKSGKFRKIAEPLPILKDIQHYILHNILKKIPCSIYAKAFKPRASLKGNAKFHRNQQTLIKLDITDYFSNLHESKVFYLFFHTFGYSKSLSTLLTKLCTLNGGLPQGAPTSPYLSNLLTIDMDTAIFQFCSENGGLRYTRYADDISISGSMNPSSVIHAVTQIVSDNGLKINKLKTAVIKHHRRQIVTGVVVNQKLQAPKNYRKSIRLEMYYCQKYGLISHLQENDKSSTPLDAASYCQSLLGKINYCLQLNAYDTEMKRYREYMLKQFHHYNQSLYSASQALK